VNSRRESDEERLSPRDKWITIFGRKPVLEALNDPGLSVAKVVVADNATGRSLDDILRAADRAGTPVQRPTNVFLLDGVTNPGNVGMILRTATGAGFDGVILPRAGTPHVGPLVIKASAGVAFQAPIVNAPTARAAVDELRSAGYRIYGLSARSSQSLFKAELAPRAVFVLGGETNGISVSTDEDLEIPLHNGVESLNVAVAAAVVAFEVTNRD
jgi:23S rRNA (guanosine2251-2'-O)-methyltransferase